MFALAGFLFMFASLSASQQGLQCNFEMTTASMKMGSVSGVLNYEWSINRMKISYSQQQYFEILEFNANRGYTDLDNQVLYKSGSNCPCETSSIEKAMPALFSNNNAHITAAGKDAAGNSKFTSTKAVSLLSSVSFNAGGMPTSIIFSDGREYTTVCQAKTHNLNFFVTPNGCKCGRPLDIVLVLDRSGSINRNAFNQLKTFLEKLVTAFEYGPLAVNLGITHYNTNSWDGPVDINQGNTNQQVSTGVKAIQCCVNSGAACCPGWTSTSSGIRNGAMMLATAQRKNIAKLIITITDGNHNTPFVGVDNKGNPYANANRQCSGNQCVSDLQLAVNFAKQQVPGVIMIAVAIGTSIDKVQLKVIADGSDDRVITATGFGTLDAILKDLVAKTCQGTDTPCGNCCGFCACGKCQAPDACSNDNRCTQTKVEGSCCKRTDLPDTVCDDPKDLCKTYACDNDANGGKGACEGTLKPTPPSKTCWDYVCNVATGIFDPVLTCDPKCTSDAGCPDDDDCTQNKCIEKVVGQPHTRDCFFPPIDPCNDNNICTIDTCEAKGGCTFTPVNNAVFCDDKDPCTDDMCDTAGDGGKGKCVNTPVTIPPTTQCAKYSCDAQTGTIIATDLCPGIPECQNPEDCDDATLFPAKDACNHGKCVQKDAANPNSKVCEFELNAPCNDFNMCTDDRCDKVEGCLTTTVSPDPCDDQDPCTIDVCNATVGANGSCVFTNKLIPDNTTCSQYYCNGTSGDIVTIDRCGECELDADCDDKNDCTIDVCLQNQLAYSCNWTTITCEDDNNCTIDTCEFEGGCLYTALPENFCDDKNLCTDEVCDAQLGCQYTNITCETDDLCLNAVCAPEFGCQLLTVVCPEGYYDNDSECEDKNYEGDSDSSSSDGPADPNSDGDLTSSDARKRQDADGDAGADGGDQGNNGNGNNNDNDNDNDEDCNSDCSVAGCNSTTGCYLSDEECSGGIGAIAGIAAGVVAGIVIAAIAGTLLVGGGGAVAYTQAGGSGVNTVVSDNPLFQPQGNSGSNPLNRGF